MLQTSADSVGAVELVRYHADLDQKWDAALPTLLGATTLHSRMFLGYHGSRFLDRSLLLVASRSEKVVGVMPAAQHPQDTNLVVSHPGSPFGGLLLGKLDAEHYSELFARVRKHFADQGYEALRCKTTPSFVSTTWNEVPTHYGLRHGTLARADLWNAIRLDSDFKFAPTRRSDIKSAVRKGITSRLANLPGDWEAFHQLLVANLKARHNALPVHSIGELIELHGRLGANSRLLLCVDTDGGLLAGVWLIDYGCKVLHTQYICSNEQGRAKHAVDVVLSDAIDQAKSEGYLVFSFGTNTMPDGWSINYELMKYKLRFGAGAILHTTFDFDLKSEV